MAKNIFPRKFIAYALLFFFIFAGTFMIASNSSGDNYPAKPIELLIPWNPGGGTDTTIRLINKVMPKYMSQRLILINKPGGHGAVAMTELINAKPDGYKICITASGPTTSLPHQEKVPYSRDDYIPVIQLTNVPNLLVVNPDTPYKNFKDFLDAAKKNPGGIKIGTSGVGAVSSHLPLMLLEKMAGVKFTTIPYKGGGDAAVQVVGGHIPAGSVDLMASGNHISNGKLRPLAIFTANRSPVLPNVPTLKELGYDIQGSFFNMIIVPKGTPQNVIDVLHAAFKKCIEDKEVYETANNLGLQVEYLGPKECRERINKDYAIVGELYKELGLAKN
jgi:tripartite-type tricarboxylate transporter receptor subunit TctC